MTFQMPSKNPPIPASAPGASPPAGLRVPAERAWPRVDDHLVEPETRTEMVRGRLLFAPPAKEPHADVHVGLGFAVRGLVRPGYIVADDLLTRFSEASDFATDISVRKTGIDPSTGARYLEELAFEVVSTQSMRHITERAEDISARGVRRVFAIFVKKQQVAEWSPAEGAWKPLPPDGILEDECLVAPLPARALLDAARGEDTVARALLAKKNPALEEAVDRAFREGLVRGVERLCDVLGVTLDDARRAALGRMDAAALEALLDVLARERRWPG